MRRLGAIVRFGDDRALLRELALIALDLAEIAGAPPERVARLRDVVRRVA